MSASAFAPAPARGWRRRVAIGLPVLALVAAAAWAAWARPWAAPASAPPGRDAALQRLQAACSQAMLQNNCRVMTGAPAAGASVVFIAGVGPVDGQVYEQLRASGDAMCGTVRQACERDWDGGQCRTARAMFSVEPPLLNR
ncbi:hypothetical protein [Aquabacterium sp. J223]|uniref:hypothetical protein n=1 Tax=Aquabacterium sp. J223 TaxID=2898431 RepID=UPI0021AD794C|nr:hypothetical protein [Aquabacterium sp. J223]UUX94075.1 hypothetical protein LRS07_12030 [Aquabacterium sp. J223]